MIVLISLINLSNILGQKMSISEEYGAFKEVLTKPLQQF